MFNISCNEKNSSSKWKSVWLC